MYCIRNIRWIDLSVSARLGPSPTEDITMKGQKGYLLIEKLSSHGFSISALLHKFSRWYELHHERELLAGMSDEALKDIGVSRADVDKEDRKSTRLNSSH